MIMSGHFDDSTGSKIKNDHRWTWLQAPESFIKAMAGEYVPAAIERDHVLNGRYEWFLACNEAVKLGSDNRTRTVYVIRGRRLRWCDGERIPHNLADDQMWLVSLLIHDSGLFMVHDESEMVGYSRGLCPKLPLFVCHRLDIAYTRFTNLGDAVWRGMPPIRDRDSDRLIHNLKPIDPSLILAPVAEETETVVEVSVRGRIRAGSDLEGAPPAARRRVAEDDSSGSEDEVVPLGTGKGAVFTDSI